jgi:hypothetical protein
LVFIVVDVGFVVFKRVKDVVVVLGNVLLFIKEKCISIFLFCFLYRLSLIAYRLSLIAYRLSLIAYESNKQTN